jgi:hypothetical protein
MSDQADIVLRLLRQLKGRISSFSAGLNSIVPMPPMLLMWFVIWVVSAESVRRMLAAD